MDRQLVEHNHRRQNPEFHDIFSTIYGPVRERRPDDPTNDVMTITFQVTEDCNLNCSYCYQTNKSKKRMSLDTAKKAIDLILNDTQYCRSDRKGACILEFIGGEPLLEIDLIENIYRYFVEKASILNHEWLFHHRISICSNGILFNSPRVIDFLNTYGLITSMAITIDGPKELHDSCRKFHDGTGSHDIVEKSVHLAQNRFRLPDTKVTISPENLKWLSTIIPYFYENFKYTDIMANCTFEGPWTISDANLFYHELKYISEYCDKNDTYEKLFISLFEEKFFTPMDYSTDDKNWCGGCGDMIAISPDGYIYPCLRYMPSSIGNLSEHMIIGHVDRGILTKSCEKCLHKELTSITATSQSTETCIHCPVASGCAWCSAYNYESTGTVNKRVTNICLMHKARALANCLYWNTFYLKHHVKNAHELYLPESDAIEIIGKDEYQNLCELIQRAKEALS